MNSIIVERAFLLHEFKNIIDAIWSRDLSELESIIFNIVINFERSINLRTHSLRFRVDSQKSSVWLEEWNQLRDFAKIVKNFFNVIGSYRAIEYYRFLDFNSAISQTRFSSSSIDEISLKLKEELNFFARISRISRRSRSVINTKNVFIRFDLRSISSQASSYSSVINSFSRRAISDTFVDEIIHHEFIESQSAHNMKNFIQKQQRTIVVIVRKAIQIISRERNDDDDDAESFDSFDSSESSNQIGENVVDNDNSKWNSTDFDFFDFHYDDKFIVSEASVIVHIDKDIYFRDVHLFIVRVKKLIITKDEQLVRNNLWFSLQNIALEWWIDELSKTKRRMTRMIMIDQKKLVEWISLLHRKFKQSINVIMNSLIQQRYILRDAASQRESRKYAQKIIRLVKDVDMISVLNQLDFIYNDIDVDVRIDILRRFKISIIVSEMLDDMNEFKHDWWIKAVRLRNNIDGQHDQNNKQLFRQDARSQQFDQYIASNRQSQFQRQSFQSQRQFQSFQFRYQNNVYSNQFFQQSRQDYQQSEYQQNYKSAEYQTSYQVDYSNNSEDQFSNARDLFTSSNRLQITVETTNVNASNSNQQQSSRQSFKFINNNQQRDDYDDYDEYSQRFQTTYQASVFEKIDENSWTTDEISDAHWLIEHDDTNEINIFYDSLKLYDDYSNDVDATKNVNFLTFVVEVSLITNHICSNCSDIFAFKNQLFKHFRDICWIFQNANHATFVIKLFFVALSKVSEFLATTKTSKFFSVKRRIIQSIVRFNETNPGYVFRKYQYAQADVRLEDNDSIKICIDIDCSITMIERKFFIQLLFDVSIQKLTSSISVRDVEEKIVKSDEYMLVKMSFDDTFKSKQFVIDVIKIEIHFIDDFAVNLLLTNDVIYSKNIKINSVKRRLIIINCESFRVSIEILSRTIPNVKRIIRSRQIYILMLDELAEIFVTYHDFLSDDRDFLFEFHCQYDLDYDDDVYVHVVNNDLTKMFVRNAIGESVTLVKRIRLGTITKYNQADCYMIMSEKSHKIASDWMNDRSWKKQLAFSFAAVAVAYVTLNITSEATIENMILSIISSTVFTSTSITSIMSTISQIDFSFEHVLSNEITVYDQNVFDLVNLVNSYQNIFQNNDIIVDIFEKKWMSINLKSEAMFKANKIYSLRIKNRAVIDATFDKLHEQSKLHWIVQSIEFSYSAFVIWRNISADEKKRVMINIRELNDIIENDNYSLFFQSDIIAKITESSYIFIIDVVDWFHQFNVRRKNRHKFTIVTHRDQEKFNVILMNYKNSSSYVQRQTNKLLRFYKHFAKIYVNDIIIHSQILKKHIVHLQILFQMFRVKRISLTIDKSFLFYSSITLLNQKVNNLDMFISIEKITAIISFRFSFSLRDLKIFMKLIDWLRSFISRYVQRVQSLQKRKITLTKKIIVSDSTKKRQINKIQLYDSIHEKRATFRNLQIAFVSSTFFIHFDKKRRLYIDLNVFKQWNFAVIVYHVLKNSSDDTSYSRTVI